MRTADAALAVVLTIMLAAGCQTEQFQGLVSALSGSKEGALDTDTIAAGLKEALRVGTRRAVDEASREGGYLNDPELRISLPEDLDRMADVLRKVGLGGQVDRLELKMNQAAEEAAVQAAPVFIDAIAEMSFEDVRQVLTGGQTAATDYLRGATGDELKRRYEPIVETHLNSLGLVELYNRLLERYRAVPLTPEVGFRPTEYVTDEALDGLFSLLAEEEQKIRTDPAARSTELLKLVFGN